MSSSVFPTLIGLAFPAVKSPQWNTILQRSASGREVRVALMSYPLWKFGLTYDVLRGGTINGNAYTELQQLANFYNTMLGPDDDFLFTDPDDSSVTDATFGIGDGATAAFQLLRSLSTSGFAEPVMNVNVLTNIKDNGVAVTQGAGPGKYTIDSAGLVTFGTVPTAAHVLTWTGTYYFRCRFLADSYDFEKFMQSRWQLRKLELLGSLGLKV